MDHSSGSGSVLGLLRSNREEPVVGDEFVFEEPWETAEHPDLLLEQLKVELPEGHPLYKKVREVLAIRVETDDILVRLGQGFAMVHLTWCRRSQPSLPFPHSVTFDTWAQFEERLYLPDRKHWLNNNPLDGWDEVLPADRHV